MIVTAMLNALLKKTDIASFYKEMFNVGDDADDGGVAETTEKEAVLPAAPTAEEEEENRVLASALGGNNGGVAAEETETVTEAAVPALASSEAIGEVAETVTEAADIPGLALATEPRKKRGKGPKKAAGGESKEKDIAAMKVAPKKREESRCQERKESYGFCGGEERRRSARTGCA